MASYKTIENLVNAYIKKDNSKFIKTIEEEISRTKAHGQNLASKNLRALIRQIPAKNTSTFTGQTITHSFNENLLFKRILPTNLLSDLILEDDIKSQISEFILQWEKREDLLKHGITPANKLLFYGKPGTGKTQLAYSLASQLDLPIIVVRLDELISSFLGKTGKNLREVFEIAEFESVVILLDEIDTIAKHRDDNSELGELKRVVTVLLQNIDLFSSNSILIGATNHEILLDSAIWRRFNIKIHLEIPSKQNREMLFKNFLHGFDKNINYPILATLSDGITGSQIKEICEELKRFAIVRNNSDVDFKQTLAKIVKVLNMKTSDKQSRDYVYKVAQILKQNGLTLTEISSILEVPYTTLRYNIN